MGKMDDGFQLEEALVGPDDEGLVSLVLTNRSGYTQVLETGQAVGRACLVDEDWEESQEVEEVGEDDCGYVSIQAISGQRKSGTARKRELLDQLQLEGPSLSTRERWQLEAVLKDWDDVFALGEGDRGEAKEVTHLIDTGDNQPIRQAARQVPFRVEQAGG